MTRVMRRALPAAIVAFGLATTSTAAPTAEDAIKYRNAVMEEMAAARSGAATRPATGVSCADETWGRARS